jgi:hypothetical protein
MNSDGSGYQAIITNDGGYRNPVSEKSFEKIKRGEGVESNNLQSKTPLICKVKCQ